MTKDSHPEKPEWFQLADSDAPSAQVRKVNKKLPAIAVLVTGAVIATGAFFASASEHEEQEHGNAPVITQVDNSTGATAGEPAAPSVSGNPTTTGGVNAPATASPTAPTQPGMKAPGGGHDDEDGEDEDHEWGEHDDDDDEHEGRERHERGNAPKIPSTGSKSA